ncbi:hypothetical protein SAMN05428964_1012155 [Thalassospira xiamenensis]|uniref:Uncharacterized protein n=2 Tax=Thalassospira xiamenensis TaxID=220697 RepID=A0A285RSS0_9PROT|nr:hypothetical protein SAMN05428964_1012155 [Thalassospira xiamenensis]
MHICAPPKALLGAWLTHYPSVVGRYGHLLIEQAGTSDAELIEGLRSYFESAHLDARQKFHEFIGMSLHPDGDAAGANARYPNCLPLTTQRGLFGEALAGLITETFEYVGDHEWNVPVFLFRFHDDAKRYLFNLARDPALIRQTIGRFGSDFIAIALDGDGAVYRFVSGEAKWRETMTPGQIDTLLLGDKIESPKGSGNLEHDGKGIWHKVNKEVPIPDGLRQLQEILKEQAADEFSAAILSIDEALVLENPQSIPKTDLIFLVGNDPARRSSGVPHVEWKKQPEEYTAGNDLQVVEVYLSGGTALIKKLYSSLWPEGGDDA